MLVIALAVAATPAAGKCQREGEPGFDPCPAADDFSLPMPGGMKMVFRKVAVPGKDFWGNHQRIIQIGDPQGDIFQNPQKVMVGGTFPDAGGWVYHLGKYEVSKAQIATVLGQGDLRQGAARLAELSGNPDDKGLAGRSDEELRRELAMPAAWLTWMDLQTFVNDYNKWCFADPACRAALPTIGAEGQSFRVPGFLRLPTEIEWEYAARGAGAANFNDALPFDANDTRKHAFVKPEARSKPRRIGSLEPVNGFHDMFGNVQELTAGLFQAEIGQGKAGGLAARGGSFLDAKGALRSSQRSEVGLYQLVGNAVVEVRSPSTGIRLAIGSPVLPTEGYMQQLEREHQAYLATMRAQTPSGQSLLNGGAQASTALRTAQDAVTSISPAADPKLERDLAQAKAALEAASRLLDRRNQEVCDNSLEEGVFFATLFGRSHRQADFYERFAEIRAKRADLGAENQQQVADMRRNAEASRTDADLYFVRYQQKLSDLHGCGDRLGAQAAANFERQIGAGKVSPPSKVAFAVLLDHLRELAAGRPNPTQWRSGLIARFKQADVYKRL